MQVIGGNLTRVEERVEHAQAQLQTDQDTVGGAQEKNASLFTNKTSYYYMCVVELAT